MVDITIVVPALNEERNIRQTLAAIRAVADQNPQLSLEAIVVDDGSIDRTPAIVEAIALGDPRVRLLRNPHNVGLGASFKRGLAQARGRKIMIVPGDNDLPSTTIGDLLRHANAADLVMCFFMNREIRGRGRNILSTMFGLIYATAFDVHVQYINGPCLYPTAELRRLELVSNRFTIPAEINVKLLRRGVSFFEVVGYRQTGLAGSRSLSFRSLLEVTAVFGHLCWEIHGKGRQKYAHRPRRILPSSPE